jgi:hypothetical protein
LVYAVDDSFSGLTIPNWFCIIRFRYMW